MYNRFKLGTWHVFAGLRFRVIGSYRRIVNLTPRRYLRIVIFETESRSARLEIDAAEAKRIFRRAGR